MTMPVFLSHVLAAAILLTQLCFGGNEIDYPDESLAFGEAVTQLKDSSWLSSPAVWVLDFYSPWCPTCHQFAPEFSMLAASFTSVTQEVRFGAINTVAQSDLRQRFRISTHPVVMVVQVNKKGDRKRFEVLKRRTMREAEGLRELAPWVSKGLPRHVWKSSDQNALFKAAAAVRRERPALKKEPREESRVSMVDIASAAFLSLEPFHVVDESESILQGKTRLSAWIRLLESIGLDVGETKALARLGPSEPPMSRDEWNRIVSGLMIGGRTRSEMGWAKCSGQGRGFTCGLWSIFHTATMAAGDKAPEALKVIRDYVSAFFKCEECAHHFGIEAASMEAEVRDHKSGNLWLWRLHNKVNRRTGPRYGIPESDWDYPSPESCPLCRPSASGLWDEQEVYRYLKDTYANPHLAAKSEL